MYSQDVYLSIMRIYNLVNSTRRFLMVIMYMVSSSLGTPEEYFGTSWISGLVDIITEHSVNVCVTL